jgi:hypothetical protein
MMKKLLITLGLFGFLMAPTQMIAEESTEVEWVEEVVEFGGDDYGVDGCYC